LSLLLLKNAERSILPEYASPVNPVCRESFFYTQRGFVMIKAMKRNIFVFGSICLFMAAAVFYLAEKDWDKRKPTSGENIILFGDSLAEGLGSTPGNDPGSLISAKLNREVINAGLAGDTTRGALSRLDEDVLAKNPRVVIVLLGGNDFLQRTPKNETMGNLRQIITQIQNRGAGVVLVGVRKIIYSSDYEKLAKETGAAYVPNILDETYGNKALMSDQIHPNNEGYKIFAEKITSAIEELLKQ
jgi:acyl-CoA thioesterase I